MPWRSRGPGPPDTVMASSRPPEWRSEIGRNPVTVKLKKVLHKKKWRPPRFFPGRISSCTDSLFFLVNVLVLVGLSVQTTLAHASGLRKSAQQAHSQSQAHSHTESSRGGHHEAEQNSHSGLSSTEESLTSRSAEVASASAESSRSAESEHQIAEELQHQKAQAVEIGISAENLQNASANLLQNSASSSISEDANASSEALAGQESPVEQDHREHHESIHGDPSAQDPSHSSGDHIHREHHESINGDPSAQEPSHSSGDHILQDSMMQILGQTGGAAFSAQSRSAEKSVFQESAGKSRSVFQDVFCRKRQREKRGTGPSGEHCGDRKSNFFTEVGEHGRCAVETRVKFK